METFFKEIAKEKARKMLKPIETFEANDLENFYDYEVKKTNVTKECVFFAFLPILVGSKFRWLKKVNVIKRKYYSRRKEFDDGYSYQYYWTNWKEEWRIEQIIK